MMSFRWAAVLLAALLCAAAPATGQGVITGRTLTADGLPLDGAYVTLRARGDTALLAAAASDRLGRFRFAGLAGGAYELRASYVGRGDAAAVVQLGAGRSEHVELALAERPVELEGVRVELQRDRVRFETDAAATVRELDAARIRRTPGLAEADVLRAVELLPGVISTSDYTSSYNVRGGSADQNLIMLDGLPLYNPFHLGGIFSVFNTDMISRAELYAGGFPAAYGGRVSSVLAIESDAGGSGRDVEGGVSLLAGRVALGGGLPRPAAERLGVQSLRGRVSVRRSYFDQLLRPFFEFPYHLTDVQAYGEAWTRGGARLSLTGYTGRDVLDLTTLESFPLSLRWGWGNDALGGRLIGTIGNGGTLELHAGYTGFMTDIRFPDYEDTELRSRIGQGLVRADIELPRGRGRWRLGGEANRLAYDNVAATGGTVFRASDGLAWLLGAYAQRDVRLGAWLLEGGVRVDGWLPGRGANSLVAGPRAAAKWFVRDDLAIKASAGRYAQFVHSLRDEELPLGIDIWVLADERAPHTISDQVQIGVEGFAGDAWSYGVEAFHRRFDGVITNNLADDPNDPLDDVLAGDGVSYGADLFVQREVGRVRPALTLSWLRATRTFPDFRAPDPPPPVTYAPIFDRRLDIDLLVQADLPRRVEASARVHVGTGLPYTRPLGAYTYYELDLHDGRRTPQAPAGDDPHAVLLGERNAERYPTYQRVDVSLRRSGRVRGAAVTTYVEVLNVLNRRNVLFYFYQLDRDPPLRSGISMFPLLPTLGVELRF
jgi:hypothetical protein